MKIDTLTKTPNGPTQPTPSLFVHGAQHGIWCLETPLLVLVGSGEDVAIPPAWRTTRCRSLAGRT